MSIFYSEDLDMVMANGCAVPGCNHDHAEGLYLHAKCHINGGVEVNYKKGVIRIGCAVCHAHIVDIKVADRHKREGMFRS